MPKPEEIAVLEVNGQKFDDWESVWVQLRANDPSAYFRFTAAERDPIFRVANTFPQWQKLQFKPGDRCTITLAGQLAVTGIIEVRQVAYDAHQHGVMLIGKTDTQAPARSSVDTKTGNFDGKHIQQIAQEVIAPYGVGLKVIGQLDLTPFKHMQNEKGELIWDFLERIARFRGVIMGSDEQGNFLLIGDHSYQSTADLIEGVNVKSCQCTISHAQTYLQLDVHAQQDGSDQTSGPAASEITATANGKVATPYTKLITPAEYPGTQADAQKRANTEAKWADGTEVQANITVQGWLRGGAALWKPLDEVFVKSPMAMLQQQLKIRTATFTQDNQNGTQTLLDLVVPGLLNGSPNFDPTSKG
ncbi:phage baseplate assembly protein [Bradyrhizobium sp. AZCC 2289]|uniref:phage baseplate assembly protein n=1 Tax=Bradyrhizobium sp. AZCC 2289 TaxID=3117026 RepID=UPI002FF2DB62